MIKDQLIKKKVPHTPGVYFFLGPKKEILYIGKATSLKSRVRSYFTHDIREKRSDLIERMVNEAKTVEYTVTDSVLEALILESNLIRTHKPKYNTISKDDKSYNHLVITNEEFPRVLVVRGKDVTANFIEKEIKYHFGPFTSAGLFKEALKIVRKLFKFYDTKTPIGKEKSSLARGKIDFNRQIGLYPHTFSSADSAKLNRAKHSTRKGVRANPEIQSKEEYTRTIRHIRLFFEGKKNQIIKELTKEMLLYAKDKEFEKAQVLKGKIFALTHIQDVALLKDESRMYRDERNARIESYDIAHHAGKDMVGVMTVVEGGEAKKDQYRKFKIQSLTLSNDPAALKEVLERRLTHLEWPLPQLIVVDGSTSQKNAAEFVLKKFNTVIPVVAVVKDDRHKPTRLIGAQKLLSQYQSDILLANAEAHRFAITYHREKSRKRQLS
ncbi:GIY-YIG nuclease family protein [Candidatus Pacebacteria bacterium]|nr:GIY-YIG nuclease family protein [Candidatus Paceibacterota bacterium]